MVLNADWSVVTQNLSLYTFGMFPEEQRWRPTLWLFLLISLTALTLLGPRWLWLRKSLPIAWIMIVPIGVSLLAGGLSILPIASRHWGGLTLTIILMSCSAIIAFPMGIILALGRQSKLIVIKYLSAIYIDTMRAIPLIAILFFGQLLIPLFLPFGIEVNRVSRAILAFALFVSAYVAEDIRGGLQSISRNQIEAAEALGLNKFQITRCIILPQALTIAIPALTNQAVGLLQNTSLMSILGLVELLGISRSLLANPEFIGLYIEVYVWLAGIYWIVCTLMALLARHIEKSLTIRETAI
tara:strand:+ start:642 stop:1535 length:894 start_codon:yes stop_codon:yes gene_type:complete